MPHIVQFHHPIRKDDYTLHSVPTGTCLSQWISDNLPASGSLKATCNFKELETLNHIIDENDVVSLRPVLGFGVDWVIWAALALSVATTVYAASMMSDMGNSADSQQASSVYNYNGQGNKPKLGNPVPVQYGRMPHYPDIIAPNWWEYVNNEQYYYQTFSKGIGKFFIHQHYIGETPIHPDNPDVEIKVYQPGEVVDHFDHIVWTSKEVGSADGQGGLTLEGVTTGWESSISSQSTRFEGRRVELWQERTRRSGGETETYWGQERWPWSAGLHVVITSSVETRQLFEGNVTFYDMGDDGDLDNPTLYPDEIENPLGWDFVDVGTRLILSGAGVNSGTFIVSEKLENNRIKVSTDGSGEVVKFEPMAGVFVRIQEAVGNDGTYVCKDSSGTLALVSSDTLAEDPSWNGFAPMSSETAIISVLEKDMAAEWVGNFLSVPSDAESLDVGIDILFPRGLGRMNDDGNTISRTCKYEVRVRPAGSIEPYQTKILSLTKADNTPQRQTLWLKEKMGLGPGRYEIGCRRVSHVTKSAKIFDEVQWMGLKSVIQSTYQNDAETVITVKIKATNALSQQANSQYWCDSTRVLDVRQVDGSYQEQASRSIADAVIDACRNDVYGAALVDDALDLDTLLSYRNKWDERGDSCDGLFDQPTAFWDAINTILKTGRSYPRIDFGTVSLWRDEPRDTVRKPYSPVNMTPDSFSADTRMLEDDDYDGVEVEWFNPKSRKSETLLCTMPSQHGYNPKPLKLPFVTNAEQAKREGMFHAAAQAYRRTDVSFTTDLDGWESNYGDVVPVAHDALCWGASGQVIEKLNATDGNQYLLLDGLLKWEEGKPHYLVFNKGNSGIHGPYRVEPTKEPGIVILIDEPTEPIYAVGETGQKPSEYMFGQAEKMYKKCILMKVSQKGEFEVGCAAVEDDPRVDAYA